MIAKAKAKGLQKMWSCPPLASNSRGGEAQKPAGHQCGITENPTDHLRAQERGIRRFSAPVYIRGFCPHCGAHCINWNCGN